MACDLDATPRRYVDDYGIGPWQVFEGTPADLVAARPTLTGEHLAAYAGA